MTTPDPGRREGRVVAFEESVGLGEVEESGPDRRRYSFHCTQIADQSRRVDAGTAVTFSVVAARHGGWEAADLQP